MKTRTWSLGSLAGALALLACHSSSPSTETKAPLPGSCVITPPTPSDWYLHADGTLFRDSLNRVVTLRGVDSGERSKFWPYVPFDFADGGFASELALFMEEAQSWGIDAMRLTYAWAALEPVQGQDDSNWLSMYDQLVDAAWAHGIYVVVDFHQDNYAEVLCGDGFPAWTIPYDAGPPHHDCPNWESMAISDPQIEGAFDAFWDASAPVQAPYESQWDVMIARYKDRPGVIGFEPINEPEWGSDPNEALFESTTLTDFYGAMVTRIHGEAPSALIFIDPPGLDGGTLSTTLLEPNGDAGGTQGVVFAPHYYPIIGPAENPMTGLTNWTNIGAQWNVPVFVGEFGRPNTDTGTPAYIQGIWNAFDTLGLSGTQWEYSITSQLWNSEDFSLVAEDGGENPVAAEIIRPFARAVAGSAITQAFNPTSQTFTLSFTPESGVSEVSLPARAYPAGYTVAMTGGCFDVTSKPGTMLVQPSSSATAVSVTVTPKP